MAEIPLMHALLLILSFGGFTRAEKWVTADRLPGDSTVFICNSILLNPNHERRSKK